MSNIVYKEYFHENGKIWQRGYKKEHRRIGHWECFYNNGNLKWFATFDKNHNLVGYSEDYDEDGKL